MGVINIIVMLLPELPGESIGKPTLALLTDKREAYNPAAADFAEVVNDG